MVHTGHITHKQRAKQHLMYGWNVELSDCAIDHQHNLNFSNYLRSHLRSQFILLDDFKRDLSNK